MIPGEITLAHLGILFLDEFPEFRKDIIEGLREPLQNGGINLHRIGHVLSLPARFTLVAAMNPCPCGYSLSKYRSCRCSMDRILTYRKRISGAMLDRMDLFVVMSPPEKSELSVAQNSQSIIEERIQRAVSLQEKRFNSSGMQKLNGDLNIETSRAYLELGLLERQWVEKVYEREGLSLRSLFKTMKVARTIADLNGEENISLACLREAWGLRCPDSYSNLFGS